MGRNVRPVSRRDFVRRAMALSSAALLGSCSQRGGSGIFSSVNEPSGDPLQSGPEKQTKAAGDMPLRTLGRTGLTVSCLSFGGGSMFKAVADGQWEPLLERAVELGVNLFDTHRGYGTEARFGTVLPQYRDTIHISTKIDARDYGGARTSFGQSLSELKTDYVDMLFVHSLGGTDDLGAIENGVWRYLQEQKAAGTAKFIGFSSMNSASKSAEFIDRFDPDVCILALSPTGYGTYRTSALPAAKAKNVGVMAIKVLKDVNLAAEQCFAYALDLDGVHTAVVGHDRGVPQLEENVEHVKAVAQSTGVKLDHAALERRLAPYASPAHLAWARTDYRDNGNRYRWA